MIVDIATGLIFIYLLFSLLCSAVSEMVAAALDLRAVTLKAGIGKLLGAPDPKPPQGWRWLLWKLTWWWPRIRLPESRELQDFYQHALVDANKMGKHLPAYISKETFSAVLLSIVRQTNLESAIDEAYRAAVRKLEALTDKLGERAGAQLQGLLAEADKMIAAAEGRARAYLKAELTKLKAEHHEAAAIIDKIQADALTRTTIAKLRRDGDSLQDAAKVHWAAMCDQLVHDFRFACDAEVHRLKASVAAFNPNDDLGKRAVAAATEALADLLSPALAGVRRRVEEIVDNPKLREQLRCILDETVVDYQDVKDRIEGWFDRSMEQVSGWYKRHAQRLVIATAVAVVVMTNADTAMIARSMVQDEGLRTAVVRVAEASLVAEGEEVKAEVGPDVQAQVARLEAAKLRFDNAQAQIAELKLPIGWDCTPGGALEPPFRTFCPAVVKPEDTEAVAKNPWNTGRVVEKILGLLATICAVSLGAPFWFDLLNKVVNLRMARQPPRSRPRPKV